MSEALSTRGYILDDIGGGPSAPTLSVSVNTIDVIWTSNVDLTVIGQVVANWSITTLIGQTVSVLGVTQVDPTTTRLTTSDQTIGGSYILNIPAAAVTDQSTGNPNAYFTVSFVGVGHLPSFTAASPESTTSVLATFSEPVVEAEATTKTNYNIDNGLSVTDVAAVTSTTFLLTTTEMTPATIYTVTVSGIHDLAGNPVT